MDIDNKPPTGYCPHCDYAMDPGRCPECGKIVPGQSLATIPRYTRKKRRMRRLLALSIVCLMLLMAYGAFRYVNWVRLAPTSLLVSQLDNMPGFGYRAREELHRRYLAGDLSSSEAKLMFDGSMGYSIAARSPHPAHEKVTLREILWCLPPSGCERQYGSRTVTVDGLLVPDECIVDHPNFPSAKPILLYLIPGMEPGTHIVEVRRVMTIVADRNAQANRLLGLPHRSIHSDTIAVLVEDKAMQEYVAPVWSENLANTVMKDVHLLAHSIQDPAHGAESFHIWAASPPVVLAAGVEIRPSGSGEFTRLHTHFTAELDGVFGRTYELPTVQAFRGVTTLDVRLVPDARIAFDKGLWAGGSRELREYFSGVIEWSNIEWSSPKSKLERNAHLPSRIIPPARRASATTAPATPTT